MPTPRENIAAQVDEMISKGIVSRDLRDQYINMMAGNEQLAGEFNNRLAGGSYFTRRAQEDAEARRRAESEIAAERSRLQQWEQQSRAQITRLEQEAQKAAQLEAELAAYRQFVKDNNYQEYIAVKETQRPTMGQSLDHRSPTIPSPGQEAPYITREYAQGVVGDLLSLQRKGFQIAATHHRLFGSPLTDDIIGEAMAANQDPEQYYRAKYNIDQKEAELRDRERQNEITRIREEERSKLMQEYSVDPSRLTGNSSTFPGMERSTLQTAYMDSAAKARNPLAEGGDPLPPERRPDLQMAADRVSRASALYAKHFNPDGKALTSEGSSLVQKHGDFSQ